MTKDPVCGMQVDEKKNLPSSNYQGTKYTFCAQGCKDKFDRNPQQYIGQSQQQAQHGQQQQPGQQQQQPRGQQQPGQQQPGQQERGRQSGGGAGGAGGGA